jgi:hypothetical protein
MSRDYTCPSRGGKAFISTFLTTEVVASPTEADVIVISDNSTLHELYSLDKEFICIHFRRNKFDTLGQNISVVYIRHIILAVTNALADHLERKEQMTLDDLMDVNLASSCIISETANN